MKTGGRLTAKSIAKKEDTHTRNSEKGPSLVPRPSLPAFNVARKKLLFACNIKAGREDLGTRLERT